MDDGYADSHRQYDRAELAEQKLEIAVAALKHIQVTYPQAGAAVNLALRRIETRTQRA